MLPYHPQKPVRENMDCPGKKRKTCVNYKTIDSCTSIKIDQQCLDGEQEVCEAMLTSNTPALM
jgi:hypothetical protein